MEGGHFCGRNLDTETGKASLFSMHFKCVAIQTRGLDGRASLKTLAGRDVLLFFRHKQRLPAPARRQLAPCVFTCGWRVRDVCHVSLTVLLAPQQRHAPTACPVQAVMVFLAGKTVGQVERTLALFGLSQGTPLQLIRGAFCSLQKHQKHVSSGTQAKSS